MNKEQLLRKLFALAVDSADPIKTIPKYLPPKPKGRVIVIGAGKASARMAEAVEQCWGTCEGVVITRYGYARPTKGIEIVEAGHPISDQNALLATQKIKKLVSNLSENDFVLCLISGGGSALLCEPIDGLSLADKQLLHKKLLASGAPISAMNIVRKHFSKVKGGQLAAFIYPVKMLTLMISDVPGDHIKDIASGPTAPEDSSVADVMNILSRYRIELPTYMIDQLNIQSSVIPADDERLSRVENIVISAPSQSLIVAQNYLLNLGYRCEILGDDIEGEAREVAKNQIKMVLEIQKKMTKEDMPTVLLSGGECTVTSTDCGGIGGPNAEFSLAAAVALNKQKGIYLLACDTDGVDGADEVAGAYVEPNTLDKAEKKHINANQYLQNNDSHTFFKLIDSQVVTGPTLTNVNDFRAILIEYNGENSC